MGEVKPLGNPSIVRYPDLAENAKKGIRNEVSGAKLLQGDLAEAWHEAGSDYATVAMRYSIVDATLDRATGSVISGDRDTSRRGGRGVDSSAVTIEIRRRVGNCRRSSKSIASSCREAWCHCSGCQAGRLSSIAGKRI